MIEHNLSLLLFFHVNFSKFANLISKFLLSCDFKGDYSADIPIPRELIFLEDEEIIKPLK